MVKYNGKTFIWVNIQILAYTVEISTCHKPQHRSPTPHNCRERTRHAEASSAFLFRVIIVHILEPVLISEESGVASGSLALSFSFDQGNKSFFLRMFVDDHMWKFGDYRRDSHVLFTELSGRNSITCMQKLHMNNILKIFSSITSGSFLRDPGIPSLCGSYPKSGISWKIFLDSNICNR